MKRVLTLLCAGLMGVWGYVGAYAESASNAASLSLPNKFGVTGLYTLIGTDTPGDKTLSIGLINDVSEFSLPEDPRTPHLMEVGLHAGFSITNKLEIGGVLPYRALEVSDEPTIEGFEEGGMGDILVTAKYRLLDERNLLPALGIFTMLSFPTGDEEKGLGSGTVDFTFGGSLTKHFGPLNLYGNTAFLLSGWEEGDPNPLFDNYQNSLLYGFGIEFPIISDRLRLFSEVTFVHEFGEDEDNQIMTFRGLEADDMVDDEVENNGEDVADDEVESNAEEPIITPQGAVVEDVVDDAGQVSIGVNIKLTDGLFLSGGAAYQILGEEPVPDGPDWRGFMNLSYVFGRRKAAKPAEIEPLAAPAKETPNRCPEITDVSLSDSVVNGGEQVKITVNAIDPDEDELLYFWIASRGILTGHASQVIWTVSECSKADSTTGMYDLTVEVSDGECSVERLIQISVVCDSKRPGRVPDSTILFPLGSTKLNNIAKAQLDTIATLLKQFPDQTIIIEGHTDATGKEEVNKRIGLKRTESVKQYLVKRHGIDPNRMTITSYGSTRPVNINDTEAGRAKNRRVEIYRRF